MQKNIFFFKGSSVSTVIEKRYFYIFLLVIYASKTCAYQNIKIDPVYYPVRKIRKKLYLINNKKRGEQRYKIIEVDIYQITPPFSYERPQNCDWSIKTC